LTWGLIKPSVIHATDRKTALNTLKTRLSAPADAFVRKFSAQKGVSISMAINQIISQVVKNGGINVQDTVSVDDTPVVPIHRIRTHSDDEPAI